MQHDQEQKIFQYVLWAFLLASLIFFIARLSTGRIFLPAPAWYMFLFLAAGFIIFIFVPHAGRGLPGTPGKHEEAIERHRWYPRDLGELIERREGPAPAAEGVRPPSRAVPPVPLAPLLLLLAGIVVAYPNVPGERQWETRETTRIREVYARAADELAGTERLAEKLAAEAGREVDWSRVEDLSSDARAALIERIDSLATATDFSGLPFSEAGIQVFSPSGARIAWGGSPRYLENERPDAPAGTRVFTSRAALFTLLVCEAHAPGAGRIVVDAPLEVNYRINNRFLRSTGIGEAISRRYGAEIEFAFSMGEHGGVIGWLDPTLARRDVSVTASATAGVQAVGVIHASTGLPLARLRVTGRPYASALRQVETRKVRWAGFLFAAAFVIVAVWVFRRRFKRRPAGRSRSGMLVQRVIALAVAIVAIRYVLLRLDIPGGIAGTAVFDGSYFADALPGGFMRNAGDFLVSSIFALILVFGSIKAFRTYYQGHLERPLTGGARFSVPLWAAKAAILFGALWCALEISRHLVWRVVSSAVPRLVGPDVNFLDPSVLALHLALLFMVSAVFIAVIFTARLALVWGGGRLGEALAASAAALVGAALVEHGHWPLLLVAAGLVALSLRIFPLLKKEETVSVIFASFFLVLVCSLAVYSVASERYGGLWRGYVAEKAADYNRPEDNWMQILLPDICAEISGDPAMVSRIVSRKESAAFEIWAESSLSRQSFSSMLEVFDADGVSLSRFAVGMPFEIRRERPDYRRLAEGPYVEATRIETRRGAVLCYLGYAPAFDIRGDLVGWVEITVPYFFENPELLARAETMAPEILHNIEPGGGRRSDRPESELIARVEGDRVVASSDPALRAGSIIPAHAGEWLTLPLRRSRYECALALGEGGKGYLVGFRVPGFPESLLEWATVISLDVLLTLLSLLVLVVLKNLPVLKGVMPDISPGRRLGFRQKVLLSFLVVSMLPVVILGVFSSELIARRFRAEGESKALQSAQTAASLIEHSIRTEAVSFAGGQYIGELLASEGKRELPGSGTIDTRRFTLIGTDGAEIYGSAAAGLGEEQVAALIEGSNIDRVTVSYVRPVLYGGVVVPILVHGNPGGYLYYRRALDDEFVRSVALALGTDININIYYDALVRASSERELFVGGFLDPICPPVVFADIALGGSRADVLRETLGDYSYYVASAPLAALGGAQSGVLSVPMLYQPLLLREEVRRTSTLILGLLAILFAATVTLGMFLAGKIFNPIAALQGGTRKIIEGELEFRLEPGAPDEIGELVESFNTMTAALREARRGLLERQRYLSAVLDNIATGVMATDRGGTIITLNPAGERILGVRGPSVVGRKPAEVFDGGLAPLRDLFSAGGEEVREAELALRSGEEARTVKAVVASLVEGGERLGTVVVFDDLTELIRTKKLAAWVEMARQIAHEVKNPLTPIKLSAQLMKRAYESKSEEFGTIFKSGVETVITQTEILRRIATEFSSFGKSMRLAPETVRLDEFLGEVVSYYRGAERLRVSLACEQGLAVRADREALRKILVNFIENAIEAMPGGGDVAVDARREGENARIRVVDSGKGLSSEYQARLFEPYFSTKTNGIGLGLAISQSLARAMDGEIRLQNREGARGVEATVTIPLARA